MRSVGLSVGGSGAKGDEMVKNYPLFSKCKEFLGVSPSCFLTW